MANSSHLETPLNRLIQYIRIEKKDIKRLVVLTVSIGVLSLATPVAIQALVNVVTMGGVLQPLYILSFMLFVILCVSGMLYMLERYIVELIQRRFFVRKAISTAINTQLAKAEIHDEVNSVELMNRFFDVMTVQKSAASLLTYGLSATLQGIIGSIVLMFYSFYFAIIVLIVLVVIYFVVFVVGKMATQSAIKESKSKYKVAAWLEVIARNTHTFKFLNGGKFAIDHTDELAHDYLKDRKKHFNTLLCQNITGIVIYAAAGTAMLALGGKLVIEGQINLGQFVAAELIIFSVLVAYRKFVEYLEYYYDLVAAFDKLGMIDDLPQENHGSHALNTSNGIGLTAKALGFHFNPNKPLIHDLSFTLKPNESLCIIGESGTGKSTLAELLTGLRSPLSGQVEMNGINLKALDLAEVRQHIGYIGQVEVIESTLLENITLGKTNKSIEHINHVLKSVNLHETVSKLEAGLDTQLGPTGAPLSRQEAQLLMLARVMLCAPKLVILDELLDGLDAPSLSQALATLNDDNKTFTLIVLTNKQAIAQHFANKLTLHHD